MQECPSYIVRASLRNTSDCLCYDYPMLGISPSRQSRVLKLFAYAFCMSGAYVGTRTVADAVFLARAGIERLPAMILITATGVALVTAVYLRFVKRLSLQRVIFVCHILLGIATLALAFGLRTGNKTVALSAGLYLLADLRGALGTIHFATLMNEMFRRSPPARETGVASAGSTLAGILVGGAVGSLAAEVHAAGELFYIPCLDLAAGFIALRCRRSEADKNPDSPPAADDNQLGTWDLLKQTPLARYLVAMLCIKSVVVLLIEYEWKSASTLMFTQEDKLAEYFGLFYSSLYLGTGFVQLFVTSRVLTRWGVRAGLVSFPLCVALVLSAVFLIPSPTTMFWGLTIARGCDVLRRGITDAAIHVMYWPLGPSNRRQLIVLNGGWVKPACEAATAMLLIPVVAQVSDGTLCMIITGVCLTWILLIMRRG